MPSISVPTGPADEAVRPRADGATPFPTPRSSLVEASRATASRSTHRMFTLRQSARGCSASSRPASAHCRSPLLDSAHVDIYTSRRRVGQTLQDLGRRRLGDVARVARAPSCISPIVSSAHRDGPACRSKNRVQPDGECGQSDRHVGIRLRGLNGRDEHRTRGEQRRPEAQRIRTAFADGHGREPDGLDDEDAQDHARRSSPDAHFGG